jgi:hypothetical protein
VNSVNNEMAMMMKVMVVGVETRELGDQMNSVCKYTNLLKATGANSNYMRS